MVVEHIHVRHTHYTVYLYMHVHMNFFLLIGGVMQCLLVQGYPASTSWGFPKGKLERGESDEDCAIREVRSPL